MEPAVNRFVVCGNWLDRPALLYKYYFAAQGKEERAALVAYLYEDYLIQIKMGNIA